MEPTTPTWQDFVERRVKLSDDPYTGVMPIVYVGPLLLTFFVVTAALMKTGPLHEMFKTNLTVAYAVAGVVTLASVVTMIVCTKVSQSRSRARALRIVTKDVSWFASIIGDAQTLSVLQANDPKDDVTRGVFYTIDAWHRLSNRLDGDLVAETLIAAVAADNVGLVHAIYSQCFPSTMHGWTTDIDKLDVLPEVLRTICLQGDFSAEALRAQTRKALYQAA
jgi:hypothetical protein